MRTAHGVCLVFRLLLVSLALSICGSQPCLAQDEQAEVAASDDQSGVDDQQKQRTAASALATLAGIALSGLALVFIILLLGSWARRIAKARRADRAASADDAASARATDGPATEPPDEDVT